MKPLLYVLSLGLLALGGTSCSSSNDATMQNPRNYKAVSTAGPQRENDRRQYRQVRHEGLNGFDLKARNPYQFRKVTAPPRYKYAKNPR